MFMRLADEIMNSKVLQRERKKQASIAQLRQHLIKHNLKYF